MQGLQLIVTHLTWRPRSVEAVQESRCQVLHDLPVAGTQAALQIPPHSSIRGVRGCHQRGRIVEYVHLGVKAVQAVDIYALAG